MTKKHTSSGPVPISFYSVPGTQVPAVFVHAFPTNLHLWDEQLQSLKGRRLLALDLRGFGNSAPPTGPMTMADYARDLLSLLDDEGIRDAHFAGCSMGGYVLMELLRQAPERIRSLALIDTRAGADTEEGRAGRLKTAEKLRTGGAEARKSFEDEMIGKLLGKTTQAQNPEAVQKVRQLMASASTEGIAAAQEAMAARPDSTEDLRRFPRPVLVVHGAEDTLIPLEEARNLTDMPAKGRMLVLPRCGHLPSVEAAEALSVALQGFWAPQD